MSNKVEKIKKFYEAGIYSRATIDAMYEGGKITLAEYEHILGIEA